MTPSELSRLAGELRGKITQGEWWCRNSIGVIFAPECEVARTGDFKDKELAKFNADRWRADAKSIALVPDLLDRVIAQDAEIDALTTQFHDAKNEALGKTWLAEKQAKEIEGLKGSASEDYIGLLEGQRDASRATLTQALTALAVCDRALEHAGKTFRWYEELHGAKGDGAKDKVKRNGDEAVACESARASISPALRKMMEAAKPAEQEGEQGE